MKMKTKHKKIHTCLPQAHKIKTGMQKKRINKIKEQLKMTCIIACIRALQEI
jgi:hypothetical protein